MLFNYRTALCIIAVYSSGAAARPGSFAPRGYSNTTSSSSSTTASSSLSTAQTTLSLSSVNPSTSSSSIISTISLPSSSPSSSLSLISDRILIVTPTRPTIVTTTSPSSSAASTSVRSTSTQSLSSSNSSSSTTSSSTTSSRITSTSTSTSSFSVTSGKNSSTTSTTYSTSSFIITSTTSSSYLSTTTSLASSNSTTSAQTGCLPITTVDFGGSTCISYCGIKTSFAFAHNTTETVTQFVTVFGNSTTFQATQDPGPTSTLPPQPCFTPTVYNTLSSNRATATFTNTGGGTSAVIVSQGAPTLTISLITSKTTVTSVITSSPSLSYDGAILKSKSTVKPDTPVQNPTTIPLPPSIPTQAQSLEQATTPGQLKNKPTINPTTVPPKTNGLVQQGATQTPNNPSSPTFVVNGVPVVLPGSSVVIGGTTLTPNAGTTAITANGKVFTINPSQIIAPGTTIARPTPNPGPAPTSAPTPTVINGVTIAIEPSIAIIDSSTYNIGPGAKPTTAVIHGQTISIGPAGVGIGSTTLQPGSNPTPAPTQLATLGHATLTEIGSTLLLGTQTFTLDPTAKPTTVTLNGQTYTIGPNGVSSGGTTVFAPQNASPAGPTQVLTAAGLTFSEIGSSIVVIGPSTFTLGAQATPTTEVVAGHTISIGPGGIGIAGVGGTTIAPPSPTVAVGTKAITAAGITFSEIGASLVVIGSSTFTMGPGATPTTDVYDGVTISIGPSGVGFAGTTVAYGGPAATGTGAGTVFVTTSGAWSGRDFRSGCLLVGCVLLGAWALY